MLGSHRRRPLRPLETRADRRAAHDAQLKAQADASIAAHKSSLVGQLQAAALFAGAGAILGAALTRRLGRRGRGGIQSGASGDAELTARVRWGDVFDLISAHPTSSVVKEVRRADKAEPDRGRAATSPADIPPRGWRDVLARTWGEVGRDRILSVAAGVTFFALLSLFPAIGAFVSLYGLFADVHAAEKQLTLLRGVVPPDVIKFLGGEVLRIADGRSGGLGVAFAISLLVSLWSANGAVKALFDGLNVAYEERERRGFLRLNLVSLTFTLGAFAFLALSLAAVVVTPIVLHLLYLDLLPGAWLAELRWPVLLLITVFAISILYRYGPSRRRPQWRWISWGAVFASLLWVASSLLFSWYVASFGHFDKTYGSLGAVVGFMTWIWYSTIIVLFGAELNSELEHQTAVDTTVGDPAPMGERGATMADTLGRASGKGAAKPPASPRRPGAAAAARAA
ncbi:MAG: YihY/virulence factor BrkB family protein [Caulobacteraceae bacterium]|nr:YihY/virulence factor BrkB family protein [Caulobacter sp.]